MLFDMCRDFHICVEQPFATEFEYILRTWLKLYDIEHVLSPEKFWCSADY